MNTDLELVNATLSGEKKAFGQLVLRYQKQVYRLVYRIIENSFDASDIVQETFVTAYQNLEQLKDRDKFSSWLFRIAKNECISWIRKYQKNLFTVEDELESNCLNLPPAPDEILIEQEFHEQVMKAISQLPEYNRKAVEMFYFEGKSYSEIQSELGVTKGTLGRLLYQARVELRKSLKAAYQSAILWISDGLKRVFKSNQFSGQTLSHCSGRTLFRPLETATNTTVISTAKCLVVSMMLHVLLFTGMSITGGNWKIFNGEDGEFGLNIKTSLMTQETPDRRKLPLHIHVNVFSQSPVWKSLSQSSNAEAIISPDMILESLPPEYLNIESVQILTVPKESTGQFRPELPKSLIPISKPLDCVDSSLTLLSVSDTKSVKRSQNQLSINSNFNKDDLIALDNAGQSVKMSNGYSTQSKVLFISDRSGKHGLFEIYSITIDEKEVEQITNLSYLKTEFSKVTGKADTIGFMLSKNCLSTSPNGKQIIFQAKDIKIGRKAEWNIYVMDVNSKNLRKLTSGRYSACSPDGRKIAFCRDDEIYVINTDGSNTVQLTENRALNRHPAWSPDGSKIAFSSNMRKDSRIRNIYVIDVDGKNQKRLTHNRKIGERSEHPAWSPDGTKIAYTYIRTDRGNNQQFSIFIMDADGSNSIPLIDRAKFPAWTPDGKKIVFVSNRDGNNEIYIIDVDGENLKRITKNHDWDTAPCWLVNSIVLREN